MPDSTAGDPVSESGNVADALLRLSPSRRPASRLWSQPLDRAGNSGNWIGVAGWHNYQAGPVTAFSASWTVPEPPEERGTQIIYLFIGMQPEAGGIILQPVLQWGRNNYLDGTDDTAERWTAFCTLYPSAQAPSAHVQLRPGDRLTGVIEKLPATSSNPWRYACYFREHPATRIEVSLDTELRACAVVLEAWAASDATRGDLPRRGLYPGSAAIAFDHIAVAAPAGNEANWSTAQLPSASLEAVHIIRDGLHDGQVDFELTPPGRRFVADASGRAEG